ncbi:MAG: hypothetical protein JXL84_17175, partial [Deltaproteobacteria bacterium]|nr:hypothetical protein [Deltaproteobacteria bacterium]
GVVDGIHMTGLDRRLPGIPGPAGLEEETLLAGYLSSLSHWLFRKPLDVEIGWGLLHGPGDPESAQENLARLATEEIAGVHWVNLADPQPGIRKDPPWGLRQGLDQAGLLDSRLDPKEHFEAWIGTLRTAEARKTDLDFIDIDEDEYLSDPRMHLPRLWRHYRDAV